MIGNTQIAIVRNIGFAHKWTPHLFSFVLIHRVRIVWRSWVLFYKANQVQKISFHRTERKVHSSILAQANPFSILSLLILCPKIFDERSCAAGRANRFPLRGHMNSNLQLLNVPVTIRNFQKASGTFRAKQAISQMCFSFTSLRVEATCQTSAKRFQRFQS